MIEGRLADEIYLRIYVQHEFLGENRQFNSQEEQKKENSAFALRLRQVVNSALSSLAVE